MKTFPVDASPRRTVGCAGRPTPLQVPNIRINGDSASWRSPRAAPGRQVLPTRRVGERRVRSLQPPPRPAPRAGNYGYHVLQRGAKPTADVLVATVQVMQLLRPSLSQ